jgi:NDP-sugar pyrophosphorylase family protein
LGRPILEWLILALGHRESISHVILATGYLGEMIEQHFGTNEWCGVHITYSRETQPLGTAGGLKLAASQSKQRRLLVLNGDSFCSFDSRRLLDVHLHNRAAATLWLTRVNDASALGGVVLDNDGRILRFQEKEIATNRRLASAGVYVIEQDILAGIRPGQTASLEREIFPTLVGQGLYGVEGQRRFVDIGTPESLASARDTLGSEIKGLECD